MFNRAVITAVALACFAPAPARADEFADLLALSDQELTARNIPFARVNEILRGKGKKFVLSRYTGIVRGTREGQWSAVSRSIYSSASGADLRCGIRQSQAMEKVNFADELGYTDPGLVQQWVYDASVAAGPDTKEGREITVRKLLPERTRIVRERGRVFLLVTSVRWGNQCELTDEAGLRELLERAKRELGR